MLYLIVDDCRIEVVRASVPGDADGIRGRGLPAAFRRQTVRIVRDRPQPVHFCSMIAYSAAAVRSKKNSRSRARFYILELFNEI